MSELDGWYEHNLSARWWRPLNLFSCNATAKGNINATGTDASGFLQLLSVSGAFAGEDDDCNAGAVDGWPGLITWGLRGPAAGHHPAVY